MGRLRHLTSQFNVRPQSESNKNRPGYKANGQRNAQELTVKAYKNGNLIHDAGAFNIPNNATVVFDEQIEDDRIQLELSGTASEFKCVGHESHYEYQDTRGWPEEMTMDEGEHQEELAAPLLWVSRGADKTLNKANNEGPTSGTIFSTTDGPDGEFGSAMVFSKQSTLRYDLNHDFDGDFAIMMAISDIFTENEIMSFSNGALISLVIEDDGSPYIEFYDGVSTFSQLIDWNGQGWCFIHISRISDRLLFSFNGETLSSQILNEIRVFGGAEVVLPGNEPKDIFDIRIYDNAVSALANTYYVNNVLEDNGSAVMGL